MTASGARRVPPGPPLPTPRGPLSEFVVGLLTGRDSPVAPHVPEADAGDEDLNLALYTCYELHYRGFGGVDDEREWDVDLLAFRQSLEASFLRTVAADIGWPQPVAVDDVEPELQRVIASGGGPSLSTRMAERGTIDELREFAVHRSAYQLKEADPHTWAIPRLSGDPKAALVLIQADEYGGGVPGAVHAERFRVTLQALGLDDSYGAYLDLIPGTTLATVNLVSLFGLHRRWRGALVGHLAIFEMASVVPMARYADAIRRLGFGSEAAAFYDVHVEADAIHEVVALQDLAAGFARAEPERAADVVFGARAVMAVEQRFATSLVTAWDAGRSSLRFPLPPHAAPEPLATSRS